MTPTLAFLFVQQWICWCYSASAILSNFLFNFSKQFLFCLGQGNVCTDSFIHLPFSKVKIERIKMDNEEDGGFRWMMTRSHFAVWDLQSLWKSLWPETPAGVVNGSPWPGSQASDITVMTSQSAVLRGRYLKTVLWSFLSAGLQQI